MIQIASSIGQQIEVAYDLQTDRVVVAPAFGHRTVWLTEAEAEALAESLAEAVREIRRRKSEAETARRRSEGAKDGWEIRRAKKKGGE